MQTAVDAPGRTVRAATPGKRGQSAVDLVAVQQELLRFADQFSTRMVIGIDQLRSGTNALDTAEALRWKLALGTEICSIASGPNVIANVLDMTTLVTVLRRTLQEHWEPRVFNDAARPMLESCRTAETEIWQLIGTVLKSEQQAELRGVIEACLQQNLLPESILAARSLSFAARVSAVSTTGAVKTDSVFSLLRMDPLAGMDPAVREITQTRMFAERALFVSQKMPGLLRWQTQLLSIDVVEKMPAVQQLVAQSIQLGASVERFVTVAEKLPGQISVERAEILTALRSQEKEIASLMLSGTQMSDSLNTTFTTFDALMMRFGLGDTNTASPPATHAEPFRIQDYTISAAQMETTARQFTELLLTLDQTIGSTNLVGLSAHLGPAVQQAQAGGKKIVDYAFWKAVLLTAIVLAGYLISRFLLILTTRTRSRSTKT